MPDFEEMKKAVDSAIAQTNKIHFSNESIDRLISKWGPEIILRCSCRDWPSHSMWGQKGYGKCGYCNQLCKPIFQSWSTSDQ
jgi:hypothetical protein